jgi:hypothetical protein
VLNPISNPAQDGTYPQEDGEASDHLPEELDNLWSLFGRAEGIGPIPSQELCSSDTRKALKKMRKTGMNGN